VTSPEPQFGQNPRRAQVLIVIGVVLLAFNLRPAAVSVGPALAEISAALRLSGIEQGVLTSLPVVAFACFGALTPKLAQALGSHRLTLIALIAAVAGMLGRSLASDPWLFLTLTLVALSGMATANVLMPSLVKRHFPDRIGLMTAVYSTVLALGLTVASVLTVPIAEQFGGWRYGLAVWAATAAIAVLPWIALVAHDRRDAAASAEQRISLSAVARTRLGWVMALFFGLQSLHAYVIFGWFANLYRSAGFSAAEAGLLLGVITGISIPLSFIVPALSVKQRLQVPMLTALIGCYVVGYLGLLIAPAQGALAWALLVGIGTSTFPMILTLIGLHARTTAGTAALSGFTQSVGYLIAALGPFLIGVLHDLTGGWTVPLVLLLVLTAPMWWAGVLATRPGAIEDRLPGSPPSAT